MHLRHLMATLVALLPLFYHLFLILWFGLTTRVLIIVRICNDDRCVFYVFASWGVGLFNGMKDIIPPGYMLRS
jgi:hypothetical protein